MSTPDDITLQPQLRVMQIIAGAMVFGVIAVLALAVFMAFGQQNGQGLGPVGGGLPILSIAALGVLALMVPVALIVPGAMVRQGLCKISAGSWLPPPETNPADFKTDAAKLLLLRQSTLIMTLAPLEGAALFGCVAIMIEGQLFTLAAIGVALLLMQVNFPTENRVRWFLERQSEQLAEMRLSKGQGK